jgi:hypothetical protein
MVVEKPADGLGENQRVIKFLGHIFVNHGLAAVSVFGPEKMGAFVVGYRFNDDRVNPVHGLWGNGQTGKFFHQNKKARQCAAPFDGMPDGL